MRAPQRRASASLIARLLAAPQGFEFAQAVTILLRWLAEQGVPPERALRDCLRFENSLRLGFPAGEIEALRRAAPAEDGLDAPRFVLTPSFMGLLGVHGALPVHYTERIQGWQARHGDPAPRAFLDMLSGRMLALHYGAWRKYRVEHAGADGGDLFMPRLLALAGLGEDSALPDPLPAAALAFQAGLLQQRPRSAAALQVLLAGHFGVPVAVRQNLGHWSRMEGHEQSALGAGARLGENTLLGARSWRPDLRARLRIGPLSRTAFDRFLPNGDMAAALRRLLTLFGVPGVDFEVQLVLRAEAVQPCRLHASGAAAPTPVRLGRDSFLVTAPATADRADMRYLVCPLAPLAPLVQLARLPALR